MLVCAVASINAAAANSVRHRTSCEGVCGLYNNDQERKMNFGFKRAAGVLAVGAMIAVAAVGVAQAQPKGKKNYTIGIVAKSLDNPVFIAAKTGAEDAAKDLGKKYGVEIKIDWQTPSKEDAQKQADLIAGLAARGADGISVSASDAAKLKGAIDAAIGKGVEVMTFDSDAPLSKRFENSLSRRP